MLVVRSVSFVTFLTRFYGLCPGINLSRRRGTQKGQDGLHKRNVVQIRLLRGQLCQGDLGIRQGWRTGQPTSQFHHILQLFKQILRRKTMAAGCQSVDMLHRPPQWSQLIGKHRSNILGWHGSHDLVRQC